MQRLETASDMAVELDGEVYLCVSEVAERLGVSVSTLYRYLPAAKSATQEKVGAEMAA